MQPRLIAWKLQPNGVLKMPSHASSQISGPTAAALDQGTIIATRTRVRPLAFGGSK
ncbi:MAG: hypothetical protein FWD12_08275 [Alphaproteobacteria bacterium]|nr:hypothetical protein [Alphaproteobacteria bacterium]